MTSCTVSICYITAVPCISWRSPICLKSQVEPRRAGPTMKKSGNRLQVGKWDRIRSGHREGCSNRTKTCLLNIAHLWLDYLGCMLSCENSPSVYPFFCVCARVTSWAVSQVTSRIHFQWRESCIWHIRVRYSRMKCMFWCSFSQRGAKIWRQKNNKYTK